MFWMESKDPHVFDKLNIVKEDLETLYHKRNSLSKEDMKRLPQLAEEVLTYRETHFPVDLESNVQKAREDEEKHPYMGFYKKKKERWLPLSGPRQMPPPKDLDID